MITHVVMWRFNDPADIDEAAERLRGLLGTVAGLDDLKVGRNSNAGPHAYELVLISQHDSFEALAEYQADPAHQEVASWIGDRVADRAVVDTEDLA